ncbi:MAG TPA: universal stress protein [Pseudonocardiaceae bacterium]
MAVPVAETAELDGGVVVGVDGSDSSVTALHHAAKEACLRDMTLHVVRGWTMRTTPRPPDCPPGAVPSIQDYEREAHRRTAELVAAELGEQPPCPVEVHVVHAPSAQSLIDASRRADLLVVGHRGRGGFAGLLLGSVAEQCVRHAHCPVVVVRPR